MLPLRHLKRDCDISLHQIDHLTDVPFRLFTKLTERTAA
jgi:hypothetical protein